MDTWTFQVGLVIFSTPHVVTNLFKTLWTLQYIDQCNRCGGWLLDFKVLLELNLGDVQTSWIQENSRDKQSPEPTWWCYQNALVSELTYSWSIPFPLVFLITLLGDNEYWERINVDDSAQLVLVEDAMIERFERALELLITFGQGDSELCKDSQSPKLEVFLWIFLKNTMNWFLPREESTKGFEHKGSKVECGRQDLSIETGGKGDIDPKTVPNLFGVEEPGMPPFRMNKWGWMDVL